MSAQGRKTGAAAETVQKREKTAHEKKGATRKRMCSIFSAVVASAYFQQKTKICRSQSEI